MTVAEPALKRIIKRALAVGLICLMVAPSLAQRGPTEEEKEKTRLRIGMSKEQQQQIEALWAETDRQSREVFKRMDEVRKQLHALYGAYDFDRVQAHAFRRELVGLHKRQGLIFAENQERLRKILTRDQFDRLTAMVREQMEQRRREWANRRHGGPGGPPKPGPE